jgi:hypothetical protein
VLRDVSDVAAASDEGRGFQFVSSRFESGVHTVVADALPAEANTAPINPMFGDVQAMELYYGLGDQVRIYVAVRHQAWAERAGNGSSLLLAMIYANGLGTARNPELAVRMACEEGVRYWDDFGVQGLERFTNALAIQKHHRDNTIFAVPNRIARRPAKAFAHGSRVRVLISNCRAD